MGITQISCKTGSKKAIIEYNYFRSFLEEDEIKIIELPSSDKLTLDSIYTRDSILVCDSG